MPKTVSITITKELKIPKVKEDFVQDKLKQALNDVCWQCSCESPSCEDCILEYENFLKLGRSN